MVSPHATYQASRLAACLKNLRVSDVKDANARVKFLRRLTPTVRFLYSGTRDSRAETLLAFSDASMKAIGDTEKAQEGVLILHTFGASPSAVAHPLLWFSHGTKRVARSTLTAEALAAVDAHDALFLTRAIYLELSTLELPTRLVIDSRPLLDAATTFSNTTETRLRVDLAALREAVAKGTLTEMTWVPTKLQLADALTKWSQVSVTLLHSCLDSGRLHVDLFAGVTRSQQTGRCQ